MMEKKEKVFLIGAGDHAKVVLSTRVFDTFHLKNT